MGSPADSHRVGGSLPGIAAGVRHSAEGGSRLEPQRHGGPTSSVSRGEKKERGQGGERERGPEGSEERRGHRTESRGRGETRRGKEGRETGQGLLGLQSTPRGVQNPPRSIRERTCAPARWQAQRMRLAPSRGPNARVDGEGARREPPGSARGSGGQPGLGVGGRGAVVKKGWQEGVQFRDRVSPGKFPELQPAPRASAGIPAPPVCGRRGAASPGVPLLPDWPPRGH